jgi:hypothetical protein
MLLIHNHDDVLINTPVEEKERLVIAKGKAAD